MTNRHNNRRRAVAVTLACVMLCAATAAYACGCDEICHPGEVYSDEAEMCVPSDKATS